MFRKKLFTIAALIILCTAALLSTNSLPPQASLDGILPATRRGDWHPGIPGGIPNVPVSVSVARFGADATGANDSAVAFNAAINAAPSGTAVHVPAGTYLIKSTITISKSVVIRGDGYKSTTINFTL